MGLIWVHTWLILVIVFFIGREWYFLSFGELFSASKMFSFFSGGEFWGMGMWLWKSAKVPWKYVCFIPCIVFRQKNETRRIQSLKHIFRKQNFCLVFLVDRKIHSSTDLYLRNENQIFIKKIANLKSIYMKVCFCLIKFTKEGLKGKWFSSLK